MLNLGGRYFINVTEYGESFNFLFFTIFDFWILP